MAVSTIANQIRNGEIEIGLAMGYEHMTAKWVFFTSNFERKNPKSIAILTGKI